MTFSTNARFSVFLVLAFCSMAFCTFCDLNFRSCGGSGKLYSVQINETCTADKEALLRKGSSVKINFTFSAIESESKLHSEVHGEIAQIPVFVPFPLKNSDACVESGLTCPIAANTHYQFLPLLEVKSSYPAVSAIVKWELQGKNGNIFCVLLRAEIVA